MTFLPIVERELRVAARKRATYWSRSLTVLVALAIPVFMLMFFGTVGGPAGVGANLFSALTNVAFFCCILAGVFLTADCLSGEKREGTLGLLFLTDWKG